MTTDFNSLPRRAVPLVKELQRMGLEVDVRWPAVAPARTASMETKTKTKTKTKTRAKAKTAKK